MQTKKETKGLMLVSRNQLLGEFAKVSYTFHPYNNPPHFDIVLDVLNNVTTEQNGWSTVGQDFATKYFYNRKELMDWIQHNIIEHEGLSKIFEKWNTPRSGVDYPMGFAVSSRYDSPEKENDFIDIDALVNTIALNCWTESERETEFSIEFNKRWRRGAPRRALLTLKQWVYERFSGPWEKYVPEGGIMTSYEHLTKWANGESIHNGKTRKEGECCPDFSCCEPVGSTPIEARKKHLENFIERKQKQTNLFTELREAWVGRD